MDDDERGLDATTLVEVLRAEVAALLQRLSHDPTGEIVAAVRPRPDDYGKAFVPRVAEAARAAYAPVWADELDLRRPDEDQTVIRCELAPAGLFTHENPLSRAFPGGYRGIAELLDPERVWVCWKCLRPGETAGMAYDGLVWLDDHWAWFPKPYRVLRDLVER